MRFSVEPSSARPVTINLVCFPFRWIDYVKNDTMLLRSVQVSKTRYGWIVAIDERKLATMREQAHAAYLQRLADATTIDEALAADHEYSEWCTALFTMLFQAAR